MTLQPNYIYTTDTPGFPHQHKTNQRLWYKHLTIPQQHYHKWKRKAISRTSKHMIPPFFSLISWALWICYCVGAPSCVSHLRRPLSSPILITNRKTKQQSLWCMMRPVFGGSTRIVLASEKSAGNKDPPVVFVYTVHLPIKMQMSTRLQLRLSKQMKKWREKGINKRINLVQTEITLIPKSGSLYSIGRQQQVCVCVSVFVCVDLHLLCGL